MVPSFEKFARISHRQDPSTNIAGELSDESTNTVCKALDRSKDTARRLTYSPKDAVREGADQSIATAREVSSSFDLIYLDRPASSELARFQRRADLRKRLTQQTFDLNPAATSPVPLSGPSLSGPLQGPATSPEPWPLRPSPESPPRSATDSVPLPSRSRVDILPKFVAKSAPIPPLLLSGLPSALLRNSLVLLSSRPSSDPPPLPITSTELSQSSPDPPPRFFESPAPPLSPPRTPPPLLPVADNMDSSFLDPFTAMSAGTRSKQVQDAKDMYQVVIERAARTGSAVPDYEFLELIGKGSFGRVYKW